MAWSARPDELLADMQQTYGMDVTALSDELDGNDTTPGVVRLATLCAQLPRDSRLARATSPALAWTDETYLLARCEYLLRCIQWMLSEDGAKGTNRPVPIVTPAQVALDTAQAEATDFGFIDSILSDVKGGGAHGG